MAYIENVDYKKDGTKKADKYARKWRAYAYEGIKDPKTKRYKRRTKYIKGLPQTEAQAEADRWEAEIRKVRSSTMKWSDWCDAWFEEREKDTSLSPSTIKRDKNRLRTLKLLWPTKRLCDIDVKACEDVIYQLRTQGSPHGKKDLKPSYIASIETSISELLEEAVRCGLRPDNPMRHVKKRTKKNDAKHDNTPTVDQLNRLVNMLDPRDRYQMAILMAARLGLRRGECLAMRWRDVDFKNKTVHVRQALKDDNVIGPPKTESSRRAISMTESMAEAFRKRKAQQEEDLKASVRAEILDKMPHMPDVLVCANGVNHSTTLQSLDSWWIRHRSNYGLKCTIHELRHGFITMLVAELGVSPVIAAKAVGHRTPNITLMVYSHASSDLVDDAMAQVELALRDADEDDEK